MKVTVFFKDGKNSKFENVIEYDLLVESLLLTRDPNVHNEQAEIPRENIEYYVVNNE